ncbi:MAG: 16S rRNA (cytosine(967)-C(5))-methyltransferase RsmB [Lachnospiraceae bacterium]|nr:16S rRNA (cytosine(967)-C(5))-methyltransferase RsmB [Lachnospiraceae bacterium]
MKKERNAGRSAPADIRKLALELLLEIMEGGAFCDKALHAVFEKYSLEKRERSFLMRLVEGTVERCIEMDYIIDLYSKVKTAKMKPVIRNILRMSVYQIFYMEQVPDSAACNEAVKLAVKRKLQSLKGFVNGVLRAVVRGKESVVYPDKSDMERYLSVRYSMPAWLVCRFVGRYGAGEAEKIFAAFLEEGGGLPIRCMVSRFSEGEVQQALEQEGVTAARGRLLSYAFSIRNYPSLRELTAFQRGMFQVQDESSMLVGQIAGIREGDTVIDVCAAPGGKTLHAADILRGSGVVVSADLTREKTDLIRENVKRLLVKNVEVYEQDAAVLREEWIRKADVLIADLPCSGLGVIGKKCDIKYKTKPEDIKSLSAIQRQILTVSAEYVKEGGRMVYSTCTIAQEENEDMVRWIEENLPFALVSIEDALPEPLRNGTGKEGYLQVLPSRTGTDGFFVSCFVRKG